MKTYVCILENINGKWVVPCGSDSYVVLDGRLNADNALNQAIEHFTRVKPSAKAVAVYKAQSLGHSGRVVATWPYGCENMFTAAVNRGAYK